MSHPDFNAFMMGELAIIVSNLGCIQYGRPIITEHAGGQLLEKGDVVMVMQYSNTKWVKVISKYGSGWLYRYEGLKAQQLESIS